MSMESSRRSVLRAGLVAGAAGIAGIGTTGRASAVEEGGGVALANVTVIDVAGGPPRPGRTVLVRGERIVAIGRHREVTVPRGVQVVDMTGKFVIPGLFDMHVHSEDMERIYPPLYLANGVTTVREMAAYPFLYAWRDRVAAGDLFGPRWLVGSPPVDGSPSLWEGLPLPHFAVKDAAEARQVVGQIKREGADFVKVYSRLSRDAFHALADEARHQRISIAGHCPDLVPLLEASDAGMRSVEHISTNWYATSSREAEIRHAIAQMKPEGYNDWFRKCLPLDWIAAHSYDPRKAAHVFARLAANDCRQVPTLTMHRVLGTPDSVSPTDPRLAYMPAATREYWQWAVDEFYRAGRTEQESAQHRELVRYRTRFVANLRRAGVPVMAGTETGTPYCYPGFSLHDELVELVAAGFTPLQALRSATTEPARFLGLPHTLGTVRPDAIADLVVLDANPLYDIRHTQQIHAVLVRGRFISAEQRVRMLAEVRAAAQTHSAAATRTGCACTAGVAVRP